MTNDKKMEQAGQILIESVVAVTMILIGLLGVLNLVLNSLRLNRDVSGRLVATYLAAEGIEVVKNIIDTNVIHLRASPPDPLVLSWNDALAEGSYEVQWDTGNPVVSLPAPDRLDLGDTEQFLCFNDVTKLYEYAACPPDRVTPFTLV